MSKFRTVLVWVYPVFFFTESACTQTDSAQIETVLLSEIENFLKVVRCVAAAAAAWPQISI